MQVNQRHFLGFGHFAHHAGVFAVVVFALAGVVEIAPAHGREQHGVSAFCFGFLHELGEELAVRRLGGGRADAVFYLGGVVAELNEHPVAGLEVLQHFGPAAFAQEALGAASVHGRVADDHAVVEVLAEFHAPAALGLAQVGFVRHGGIADQENLGFRGVGWPECRG